jgi:hypothetical protein
MSQRLRHERAAAVQDRSKWRLAGFIVGGIVGTMLVVGLIVLVLILRTTPPPVIHTDAAAAQRLQRELQEAQTAADGGKPGVVSADETELNSVLKEYVKAAIDKQPADSPAVVRDMRMNLTDDHLRLYVLVNFRGKDLTLVIEGKVHTVNGLLDFEPISGKIGSLSIPKGSLKRAVEQMAATPETQELLRLPKNLRDLHIEKGKLVVVFR